LRIPQPQIYDFENLKIGELQGQDGWPKLKNLSERYLDKTLRVVRGTGINQSHVIVRNGEGGDEIRPNNRAFSFKHFTGRETDARLQFDIRYGGRRGPWNADGYFSTGGEAFGLNNHFFQILASGNPSTPHAPIPDRVHEGDWIRLQLRLDFTANNGSGAASLFYGNLTAGDIALIPIPELQNVKLAVQYEKPAEWNHLRINIGSEIDRIAVDNLIPNMASSSYKFEKLLAFSLGIAIGSALIVRKLRAVEAKG
jgi:hypothetical protein